MTCPGKASFNKAISAFDVWAVAPSCWNQTTSKLILFNSGRKNSFNIFTKRWDVTETCPRLFFEEPGTDSNWGYFKPNTHMLRVQRSLEKFSWVFNAPIPQASSSHIQISWSSSSKKRLTVALWNTVTRCNIEVPTKCTLCGNYWFPTIKICLNCKTTFHVRPVHDKCKGKKFAQSPRLGFSGMLRFTKKGRRPELC